MNRDISQSNSKSQYVGSPSYHCSDIKWLPRNNPIRSPIKYVDLPLWQFLIINVSRISQPNSKSQYVGSPSYHRHHIQSSRGKPIQFQIKYTDLHGLKQRSLEIKKHNWTNAVGKSLQIQKKGLSEILSDLCPLSQFQTSLTTKRRLSQDVY